MFGYRVPRPDEAMLISGAKSKAKEDLSAGPPFQVVVGHGKWVLPLFRKVEFLTLQMHEAEVIENCVSRQGIPLKVNAVIAFKVANDTESICAAAQRFLVQEDQMQTLTGRIFAGHLRSIVGSMTVEEIVQDRQKLATEVVDGSKEEMARIGLTVDALQIQSIEDPTGYIQAMAKPNIAAVQQRANVAQAQADQASAEAQQQSLRKQAEFARETAVQQSQYQAEMDKAQQVAAQAGPLAAAESEQAVLEKQRQTAERRAELTKANLLSSVVEPQKAEAEKVQIIASAEAERAKIEARAAADIATINANAAKMAAQANADATRAAKQAEADGIRAVKTAEAEGLKAAAEAAAAEGKVSLDQLLIQTLPEAIRAASQGLAGSKITMLGGGDEYTKLVAGLVQQGAGIFQSLRGALNDSTNGRQTDDLSEKMWQLRTEADPIGDSRR
jgi:uncharacterized membrane protein YqiK